MPKVRHEWAVKKFARPSVNLDQTEVSSDEIRPPKVLLKTMNYLMENVIDRDDGIPWHDVHNFIRDRTRSIRQDFVYQGVLSQLKISIHEQIARFRILDNTVFFNFSLF